MVAQPLAEVFQGFPQPLGNISLLSLSLATDVTLGANVLCLGTRTGADGTATLA